jgi:hypothetical protein
LACISSPCLMPIICRLGLLMELRISSIFLPQSFSHLSNNSGFFCLLLLLPSSILSSSPKIPSSTCYSLLVCFSYVFFTWLKELFVSRVSVWFSFLFHLFICAHIVWAITLP